MGMYWGSKFVAVLSDKASECCVYQVDLKPSALSSGITETTFLPVPAELKNYPIHDSERTARAEVKKHILEITHNPIVGNAACLANIALEIEELRFEKMGNWEERIAELKGIEPNVKAEIRELKKLRRAKIETRYRGFQ